MTAEVWGATLSPTGEQVAFATTHDDKSSLHYQDLKSNKVFNIHHTIGGVEELIDHFRWLGPTRLAYEGGHGWSAMDVDGSRWVGLTGQARESGYDAPGLNIIYEFKDSNELLMTQTAFRRDSSVEENVYPDVIRMDHVTGNFKLVEKNPGDVVKWVADRSGQIRLVAARRGRDEIHYRIRDSSNSPWIEFDRRNESGHPYVPFVFDFDGRSVFVRSVSVHGYWELARLNLDTGAVKTVCANESYDIFSPEGGGFLFDGIDYEALLNSSARRRVVGLRYVTDLPNVKWIDPKRARIQAEIDAALPRRVNTIESASSDENMFLILSWSDRESGTYYVYDDKKASLTKFTSRVSAIRPDEMAEMRPVRFEARDGLPLHGYLTLPLGARAGSRALVLFVHNGPWGRDSWGYNPIVQLLANRGYAVLQVNYRGSQGFGDEAFKKSIRQIGGAIQDDITDAVNWAIKSGIADPKRIGILGFGFGGYSALWGVTQTPELYRCAVDVSGWTDWYDIMGKARDSAWKTSYNVWAERLGTAKDDTARLKAISPINYVDALRAPVLIIQGDKDQNVPESQVLRLIEIMHSKNKAVESVILQGAGHSITREKDWVTTLRAIDSFLKKIMPP